MSKVSECIKAAGISKIVWIDDKFATPTRNDLEEAILKAVVALKERGDTTAELATFGRVDLTAGRPQVEDASVAICEPLSEANLKEILAALGVATGATELPTRPDLSDDEFQQLQSALGVGLRKFSLGTWTSAGVTEFRSATEDTLFLIDKEFSREDTGSDGIELLDFLVKNTQGLCILLTHTCGSGDQEQRRMEFAMARGLPPHSFCVVSKQQSVELSVDDRFAMAICTALTHKFNGGIAHAISKTIQESAVETATALMSQSVSDLERVLFENADKEGVFEYDAVLRIFEIQQRHALNAALAEAGIQRQLQFSRKFRLATEGLGIKHVPGDMGYFRGIRAREVFFEGTGLNNLHSPLSCGDVFQTSTGEKYVLLAQPCDLMVRKDGERRSDFGLFAMISEPKKPDPGNEEPRSVPDYRYYDLKDMFGNDKKAHVDFQKMFAVNLAVIELAAFNSDGTVQLRRDQPEPSIILSKGWTLAFANAKGRFFPKKNKPSVSRPIGIGSRATNLAATTSVDLIIYPLRRAGRLQPASATALLAAWATFQTRAAFDHNFAEEREGKPQVACVLANAEAALMTKAAADQQPIAAGQGDPTQSALIERAASNIKPELTSATAGESPTAAIVESPASKSATPEDHAKEQPDNSTNASSSSKA
ncbi:MAG TPA: hypothetical protein VKV04_07290 [Verrucomicrobiae bacterium]|nr:hypothetical protein [Verrucomicrobiae bacterium]